MTSVQKCRYALWHHPSQLVNGTIHWRETPKSKALIAVVPPSVIPGCVNVCCASPNGITLALSDNQTAALQQWLTALPPDVLTATACETGMLEHSGGYMIINPDMSIANSRIPQEGDQVLARVTAYVRRTGPIRKAVLQVTDVLYIDVAAAKDESMQ